MTFDMLARRPGRRVAALAVLTSAVLAGCDGLLDVDLPGSISEQSLNDPSQAQLLVTSAITNVECGFSDFIASNASGNEDVLLRITGWWGGSHEFAEAPAITNCNTVNSAHGWWSPLHKGRYLAEGAYEKITGWDVANKERLLAQSALYAAIPYNLFGEYFCEMAFEEGPLLSPDQTLAISEEWLTKALAHIDATGDFALPATISPSARQFAHALRSRVRWSRGNSEGALADAAQVSRGFVAYATRDGGGERKRWNRVVNSHNDFGLNTVMGPVDWWNGPGWPAVIPFTGYRSLGILPDGRAVTADGYPITTTGNAAAVADSRVPVRNENALTNGFPRWTQQKYRGLDADIPLANWEEIWLIRAELAGGQAAIDLVNEIRVFHNLPRVTYLSGSDAAGIRNLIIEERRRSLFMEGRFWATKLREDLWFPRSIGNTPYPYAYRNGIRMVMPTSEFEINPNLVPSQRGTLCGNQRPV
jgi:hypothetical protein